MDVTKICEIIPHRFPFLLIDRIIELDYEKQWLVAIKNVTMNEFQFLGHYPGQPIMPGVLMVEAMAQASAVYVLNMPVNKGKVPYFAAIEGVKFRRMVTPGDQLRIEVQVLKLKSRLGKVAVKAKVDGEIAVEAEFTCMLGDPKE
ncbi:TPA: 3-hydroxyacyl-[acyl-carrier-protein] dehydratase FabZ [Candidatus Sumerlaeota bacterium]|nr:3-hydroxyacyl-[acyl-carrier-protein] dehydratase FabZ [Candidatus Sumerlaeota bacterium]